MLRILSRSLTVLALAGVVLPAANYAAEAGQRYKKSYGKSWTGNGSRTRGYHRNNGLILRIPQAYLDGRAYQNYRPKRKAGEYGIDAKPWRSGPKIIVVEEALRERRRLENQNQ